jgi:predicted transcriptional regulator
MSEKYDKWSMFKNYMANDLGITKDDIKQWIKEAVEQEAKKLIANSFDDYNIQSIMSNLMKDKLEKNINSIKEKVAEEIVSRLKISCDE